MGLYATVPSAYHGETAATDTAATATQTSMDEMMNIARRKFFKWLGILAAVVAVPSVVSKADPLKGYVQGQVYRFKPRFKNTGVRKGFRPASPDEMRDVLDVFWNSKRTEIVRLALKPARIMTTPDPGDINPYEGD